MYFLQYTGDYDETNSAVYTFYFEGEIEAERKPLFIIPPIYDVSFKKVFIRDEKGLKILKDFLNSLLFPLSQSIKELRFISKEILSNSHLKQNEGSLFVDNACIAIIKCEVNGEKVEKEVIIDFEMESSYQVDKYTQKFFNYATGLRNQNDFKETWVIALGVNRSKKPQKEYSSKSGITKKYKFDNYENANDLNYVKIYEIYLNDYYSQLDKDISVFEGEVIQEIGKEWIKLFTIELWAKGANEYCYCIPSDLEFKGSYIKKAIDILSDTFGYEGMRVNVEKNHQKEMEVIEQKRMDDCYKNGYSDANLELLDIQFQKYKKGKLPGEIILLKKISRSVVISRYGNSKIAKEFIEKLSSQNLII